MDDRDFSRSDFDIDSIIGEFTGRAPENNSTSRRYREEDYPVEENYPEEEYSEEENYTEEYPEEDYPEEDSEDYPDIYQEDTYRALDYRNGSSEEYDPAPEERGRKKSHGFLIFMLAYSVLVLTAGFFGLKFLYGYLEEYEQSRPKHAVNEFTETVLNGTVSESDIPALAQIDTGIQTREQSLAFIREKLSNAKLMRAVNECTDTRYVYTIKSGSDIVGRAVMEKTGETENGFPLWKITSSEFDFEQFLQSASVQVPENYTVYANGTKLDSSYITKRNIQYETLTGVYEQYPELPGMVVYESGKVLGNVFLNVEDGDGNAVTDDSMTEADFLTSSFKSSAEEEIKEYAADFTERYVTYTANVGGQSGYNYGKLKDIIVAESELHDRIRMAFDALGYTFCKACDITKLNVNLALELQPGVYFADVSYTTAIESNNQTSGSTDNNIRILMTRNSMDQLRAFWMSTY